MEQKIKDAIEQLAIKAKSCRESNDALRWSQSALNLAHVLATLKANKD